MSNYYRYYYPNGKPIRAENAPMIWVNLIGDEANKAVNANYLANGISISTVWLGLNHNWEAGKPLIYETGVFREGKELELVRYSTRVQALAGHKEMVKKWGDPGAMLYFWLEEIKKKIAYLPSKIRMKCQHFVCLSRISLYLLVKKIKSIGK